MRMRSQEIKAYLPPDELEALRMRAAEQGMAMSALLREAALKPPRNIPARRRIAGIEAMDAAGAMLGHALRSEGGYAPADALQLARSLHAAIMSLTVETAAELPQPAGRLGGGQRTQMPPELHAKLIRFRAAPAEEERIRQFAAVFGLPVSEYVRKRIAGSPLRPAPPPLEGLPAARRCAALLRQAAATDDLADAAEAKRLYRNALRKLLRLEEDAEEGGVA